MGTDPIREEAGGDHQREQGHEQDQREPAHGRRLAVSRAARQE